jgi:acetyl esterase/lipase
MFKTLLSIFTSLPFFSAIYADATSSTSEVPESKWSDSRTETIALWPTGTPDVDPTIPEKTVSTAPVMRIANIHNPTITVFRPASPNGCAIVICPGGGYSILSIKKEGSDVAEWLADHGITAFILKYRLPNTPGSNFKDPVPLSDALRSIQWVRYHANEFGIDPARIGIIGFSAGGHLAASVGTLFSRAGEFGHDEVARISARPDFMALIYPVITANKDFRHACISQLLPDDAAPENLDSLSREKSVGSKTPPAFLVHSRNDTGVSFQNSVLMHEALLKYGVPAKLYLYDQGGHGYGLGKKGDDAAQWPDEFIAWLEDSGFLVRHSTFNNPQPTYP